MKEFVIQYKKINQKLFDYMASVVLSPWMLGILAIWSFLEGSIWPIFPEFILIFFIILTPKNYRKLFLIAFISSILGTISFFVFVQLNHDIALNLLLKVPDIDHHSLIHVGTLYLREGVISVVKQPLSTIPIKVWTFMAANNNLNFFLYIFLSSLSRGTRFIILSFLGYIIGNKLRNFIRNNFLFSITAYYFITLLMFNILFFIYTFFFLNKNGI